MEEFQAQGYTYTELAKLNCCRMYLKVFPGRCCDRKRQVLY